jgi:hypothetical protein
MADQAYPVVAALEPGFVPVPIGHTFNTNDPTYEYHIYNGVQYYRTNPELFPPNYVVGNGQMVINAPSYDKSLKYSLKELKVTKEPPVYPPNYFNTKK